MPSRSSKKPKKDFSQVAFDVVAQLTGGKPKAPKASDVSKALDNDDLRKQVMQEMGRRGGHKGGKARAEKLSPAERKAIATNAAKKRWRE
jgi:hypothetical protein